jgi:hypothetical protein
MANAWTDRLPNLSAAQALAHATYRQLVRDPALLIVAFSALLLIVTAPAYCVFHFDEGVKVMVDTGLSTVLLAGLLIAVLGPVRTLAYELEDRTALTLLSKPVGRFTLLLGKYLGVLAAGLVIMVPLTLAVLYVARVSAAIEEYDAARQMLPLLGAIPSDIAPLIYLGCASAVLVPLAAGIFRKTPATAAYCALLLCALAGPFLTGDFGEWHWSALSAGALIAMEVAVIAAVAVAAAIRLGAVGTMAAALGVMVVGHLRRLVGPNPLDGGTLGAVASLLPGLEALNALEAAAAGVQVPTLYVATAGLYATMYAVAALLVGAALMEAREVA